MNKVLIFSDSTCDLSKELLEQYNIKIVPLHVNFSDESYLDGVDINTLEVYEKVAEKNEIPKTAAVSPGEFIAFLKPYIDEGYDCFYTGLSSKMSATYQNLVIACEELPENRVFYSDSMNLSTGIGLLLLKACNYRDKGYSAHKIKRLIDELIPHVKVQFVIKTLDYLYKGGRCSSVSKFFGTFLRLKPMIVVRDGKMSVGKKNIGLLRKAVANMTNIFLHDFENIDPEFVFITDSYNAEGSYQEILADLDKHNVLSRIEHVYHTHAGCVIGSHCGDSTIGILYIMKGNLNDEESLGDD